VTATAVMTVVVLGVLSVTVSVVVVLGVLSVTVSVVADTETVAERGSDIEIYVKSDVLIHSYSKS
jgi:hypothetical protein